MHKVRRKQDAEHRPTKITIDQDLRDLTNNTPREIIDEQDRNDDLVMAPILTIAPYLKKMIESEIEEERADGRAILKQIVEIQAKEAEACRINASARLIEARASESRARASEIHARTSLALFTEEVVQEEEEGAPPAIIEDAPSAATKPAYEFR